MSSQEQPRLLGSARGPALASTTAWPEAQAAENQTQPGGHGHKAAVRASGRAAARPGRPAPGRSGGGPSQGQRPQAIPTRRRAASRAPGPGCWLPPGLAGLGAASAGPCCSLRGEKRADAGYSGLSRHPPDAGPLRGPTGPDDGSRPAWTAQGPPAPGLMEPGGWPATLGPLHSTSGPRINAARLSIKAPHTGGRRGFGVV